MRQEIQNDNFSEAVVIVPPLHSVFNDAANDSDKLWTVPNNEMWKLNFLHVILVTSATVGNRQITIEIDDADDNLIMDLVAGTTQAASLTRRYEFFQSASRETAFIDDALQVPLPQDCYLGSGYSLRIYDSAAVDAAADDMTVSFQVLKYVV